MSDLGVAALTASMAWVDQRLEKWNESRAKKSASAKTWVSISKRIANQTKAMCARFEIIKTVAFPHKAVPLADIYVPLTLRNARTNQTLPTASLPAAMRGSLKKVFILDTAGMGKSTISKIVFRSSLSGKKQLPILVDLRRLTDGFGLEDSLVTQFAIAPNQRDLFLDFLTTEPILFILDGFDEVTQSVKQHVSRSLRDFIDRANNSSFLITSRPDEPYGDYTDFEQFHICSLNIGEAKTLISNYGRSFDIEPIASELVAQIESKHSEAVASFLANPLLTSLLLRSFEYKSVLQVKRGVFYRQVFDALFETHDSTKETGFVRAKLTGLPQDDFHRCLRALAFRFRRLGAVEISVDQFLQQSKEVSNSLCPDLKFSGTDLLSDCTNAVPLMIRDGEYVRWAHKSLLDYFLSEFLLRDYSNSKDAALAKAGFGVSALQNENFLVLVSEADPLLYAQAITIPAIEQLLLSYENICAEMPTNAKDPLKTDIAMFCMSNALLLVGESSNSHAEHIHPTFDLVNKFGQENFPDHTILMIMHKANSHAGVALLVHNAALALRVPMMFGAGGIRIAQFEANYPRTDSKPPAIPMDEVRRVVVPEGASKRWQELEDEFEQFVPFASRNAMLFKPSHLEKVRDELKGLVKASLIARSEEF